MAAEFSAKQAAIYLDRTALTWQKKRNVRPVTQTCLICSPAPHSASVLKDSGEVRRFFEQYRTERWKKKGPTERQGFWPIVVGDGPDFQRRADDGRAQWGDP